MPLSNATDELALSVGRLWQPSSVAKRVRAVCALLVSVLTAASLSLVIAPSSFAATQSRHPVRLRLLSAPHRVTAPGVLRFKVRVTNVGERTQRDLWVGSTGVLD